MIKRYTATKFETIREFLSHTDLSSHLISRIISSEGMIIVNDMLVDMSYKLQPNDNIEIVLPHHKNENNILSIKGDLDILYEDSYFLIINKPNNQATIPTSKYHDNSLANYIVSYYHQNGLLCNIHFLSRLDYPTSGIIVLAKNSYIAEVMQKQRITKKYLMELTTILKPDSGEIKTGIRKTTDSIKREVHFDNINSHTSYQTIDIINNHSIIEATLHTGKTHQLRLHFSYLNSPILGDSLYNDDNSTVLHLHSYYLEFIHPITKEIIKIINYPIWYKK